MNSLFHILKIQALAIVLFVTTIYSSPTDSYEIPTDNEVIKSFGFPTQKSLSRRLNILIWNLHKGEDEAFATDFAELAYKKDLVLGQEMLLNPAMQTLLGTFPQYLFTSATSFYMGKESTRTGILTASPVLPSNINYVRTQTLEPVVNSPKVTLISRYPIQFSSKVLTVVNIHGINFVDNVSYQKEMNRIYEAVKNYPSPLVFAGDFNSWNSERGAILRDLRRKLKLNEAKFSPDYRMRFNNYPLDHFFYTADLKIIEAKVENFYQGSDHKPLELIVEYFPIEELMKIAKK